jgi:hypothetical protein
MISNARLQQIERWASTLPTTIDGKMRYNDIRASTFRIIGELLCEVRLLKNKLDGAVEQMHCIHEFEGGEFNELCRICKKCGFEPTQELT